MANLSVASIRERIFNNTKHESNVARPQNQTSHNPFASMNGNLLNADVYVSSKSNAEKMSFSGRIEKLKKATQVGSLANLGQKIRGMVEPVVAFAKRIKAGVTNTWKKLNEMTIEDTISSMLDKTPTVKHYATADIKSTRETFKALESVESKRIQAAA